MEQYKALNGAMQWKPSLEEVQEAYEKSDGFCLACGELQQGVEPDAWKYTCESCGVNKVYGAESIMFMGLMY